MLFIEHCDDSSRTIDRIATSTIDLESHLAHVIHLEIINAFDEEDSSPHRHLIAVYEDGLIECFSENLDRKIWSSKTSLADTHQTQLVALTNLRQARKGLLKSREDILSSLSGHSDEDEIPLLILLNRDSAQRAPTQTPQLSLQIYAIEQSRSRKPVLESTHHLKKIVNFNLPQPAELGGQAADFNLHVNSGLLYQRVPERIIIYDLSGLIPQVLHTIDQQSSPFTSLLRVNAQSIAVSTSTSIATIGLKFCSVQTERQLISRSGFRGDENGHGAGSDLDTPIKLLSCFASLDLIVALSGTHLIALRSVGSHPESEGSRKRKLSNRLVDAVGRGLSKRKLESHRANTDHQNIGLLGSRLSLDQDDTWIERRCTLDEEFSQGRYKAFEEMIMSELARGCQKPEIIAQYKLSYVFGKLFTVIREESEDPQEASAAPQLRINVLPRELFSLLIRKGLFNLEQINSGLKQNGFLQQTETLQAKSFIDALAAYDSTLSILRELSSCPTAMSIQELVHVLAHTIQSWNQTQSSQTPKLLAIAEIPHDSNMVDQQPSTAPPTSNDTLQLFHFILERLSRHPQSTLTQTLQKYLSRSHLIALVDILRISLARSGWLYNHDQEQVIPSSMPSPISDSTTAVTTSASLYTTVHLLSACLDSLNAAGWILGSSALPTDLTEPADTIAFMRAEISAALEGIEEAVYLSGLLEEALLCGRDYLPQPASTDGQVEEQHQAQIMAPPQQQHFERHEHHPGSSIVPLGPSSGGTENGSVRALPLGLKLEEKVSLTKVGAGGELIKRSKRDIGHMKSQQVGKYSFERIVV